MPLGPGRYFGSYAANIPFAKGDFSFMSSEDNLTAHAGGGQNAAYPINSGIARFTTVATAADSAILPPSTVGLQVIVINSGANSMQVYGLGADVINGVASGTGVAQAAGSISVYTCSLVGYWYSWGTLLGFTSGADLGFSGSIPLFSVATVAANSGGAQTGATPLISGINMVSSAANGYSVLLPASVPGMQLSVYATTASHTVAVFPNAGGTTTEVINALSANAAITMSALTSATFACAVAGQWYTLPRVPS